MLPVGGRAKCTRAKPTCGSRLYKVRFNYSRNMLKMKACRFLRKGRQSRDLDCQTCLLGIYSTSYPDYTLSVCKQIKKPELSMLEQEGKEDCRALIGITCSRVIGGSWSKLSKGHWLNYTLEAYARAIAAGGGAPVLVPLGQTRATFEFIIQRIDGLVLSGGPDIHPRHYDSMPLGGLADVDYELDLMELELARMALDRDIPVLGICRGIQLLNVVYGGSLIQDIASQVPGAILHNPDIDKGVMSHTVKIEPESLLAGIIGQDKIWVNGRHHQAIDKLAPGLKVSALAPDGIVEAVEASDRPFAMGVQWHPEGTWKTDIYSRKLFSALVKAASGSF